MYLPIALCLIHILLTAFISVFCSSIKDDSGVKEEVKEVTPSSRHGHTYKYVMPLKLLALELGDGSRFLHETSFSNVTTETYPPLVLQSIVKCKNTSINITLLI